MSHFYILNVRLTPLQYNTKGTRLSRMALYISYIKSHDVIIQIYYVCIELKFFTKEKSNNDKRKIEKKEQFLVFRAM